MTGIDLAAALPWLLLAACSTSPPEPDAQHTPLLDASPCPSSVTTWRDALVFWDGLRCDSMARCFPSEFLAWYGNRAGCLTQLGAWHCAAPAEWCNEDYPRERCGTLLACQMDVAAIECDPSADEPASCHEALR